MNGRLVSEKFIEQKIFLIRGQPQLTFKLNMLDEAGIVLASSKNFLRKARAENND